MKATTQKGNRVWTVAASPPRPLPPRRADPNAEPSTCRLCGSGFALYGHTHHAYCRRCAAKADREIARTLRARCKACGGRFSTSSRLVRYCSDECRAEGLRRSRIKSALKRMAGPGKRAVEAAQAGERRAASRPKRRGGAARAA